MRDILLYLHIILGLALIVIPILILNTSKKKSRLTKPLSLITAIISWVLIYPAGKLYITFYPATKTLIKAGAWPWAHSVFMETKEHWGLLLPLIATLAAGLVYSNNVKESRKWWVLLIILSVLIGIMGRIVTMGGVAR